MKRGASSIPSIRSSRGTRSAAFFSSSRGPSGIPPRTEACSPASAAGSTDLPTAVELRHGSWNAPSTEALLSECGLAFCNIDQPAVGESMPPTEIVTDRRLAYIRLHGRNRADWARSGAGRDERYDYLYREEEMDEWRAAGRRIAAKSDALYIITNNHFRAQALVNAFQMKSLLSRERQRMPDALVDAYPSLRSIAIEPPGQETLF